MEVDREGDDRRRGNVALGTLESGRWQCSNCNSWHTASAFQCRWWTVLANGSKHFFYSCELCTLRYQHQRQQERQAQAQAAQQAQAAAAMPADAQELAAWFQTRQTAHAAAEAARAAAEAAEAAPTAASSSASSIFPSRDQVFSTAIVFNTCPKALYTKSASLCLLQHTCPCGCL